MEPSGLGRLMRKEDLRMFFFLGEMDGGRIIIRDREFRKLSIIIITKSLMRDRKKGAALGWKGKKRKSKRERM